MLIQIKPLYDYPQDHLETLMINTRSLQRVVRWPSASHAGAVGLIFMLGFEGQIFSLQISAADMAAIESAIKLDNIVDQASGKLLADNAALAQAYFESYPQVDRPAKPDPKEMQS